jgi:VanZ family protein
VTRWVGAWGPAAGWAAFLFFMSSRETIGVDLSSGLDKVAHFGAYLVLGFLLAYGGSRFSLIAWVAVAIGVLYGASDEIHQSFVPGRSSEVADWVADALGTVAGVLIYHFLLRRRAERSRPAANAALEGLP